ncbi:alpha/beta hydrolase [Streptomyces camponoticapitis]|uniref:Alpha/beta hydrolase n=1 Tax=Streptomyces camponoticapitis TaxID=1616125 RepID=A0ABQ2EX25_9ACTN|nr:alpha/beta hydrolase [Streptomyces camponoticapitis]GGK24983.1 alpha/beta hydrolase [Streptomyces camponoticapitis]
MKTAGRPTVVLVHGAFADASSWAGVISRLQQNNVRALAVANELRGGAYDGARLAALLHDLEGPVVLVGHSYGGVVIAEAASRASNVNSLVFVGAFALEEGESPMDLLGRFPANDLGSALVPMALPGVGDAEETWLRIDESAYSKVFAADVDPTRAKVLAVSQRPILASAFDEKAGPAAWRTVPTHHLITAADEAIPAEAQRAMATRTGGTSTEIAASHAVAVSRPGAVTAVILEALKD